MLKQKSPLLKSSQEGIVLLEAMIAILIFSFAILGIVGLQAAMIKNISESKFRAEAAHIAQQTIGQMWADPANLAASGVAATIFSNSNVANLPSGTLTVAPTAPNQYRVTVTWQQPGEVQHNFTTLTSINGV